jgi:sulfur carrier protein
MITVNGEALDFHGQTIIEILVERGLDPARPGIAVAVNGAVVRRAEWPERTLADNAWVEIVQAKTGG